jgi:hypothetical protein
MRSTNNMRRSALAAAALAASLSGSPARAASASCTAFRNSFLKATSDLKSDFVRPLTVTRAGSEKNDVYDLVSTLPQTDAVLSCRGETLERFEANLATPADPTKIAGFTRVQKAAVMAAFKWPESRTEGALRTINAEADEYLKASIERGDVVQAGKTEYHEGGGDLGMMYTPRRRTFVVVGGE